MIIIYDYDFFHVCHVMSVCLYALLIMYSIYLYRGITSYGVQSTGCAYVVKKKKKSVHCIMCCYCSGRLSVHGTLIPSIYFI